MRFLKDSSSRQLANIAADLARIQSFLGKEAGEDVLAGLIEESRFFAEWAAPAAGAQERLLLRRMMRSLTRWRKLLPLLLQQAAACRALAGEAGTWSKRMLAVAGLLPRHPV